MLLNGRYSRARISSLTICKPKVSKNTSLIIAKHFSQVKIDVKPEADEKAPSLRGILNQASLPHGYSISADVKEQFPKTSSSRFASVLQAKLKVLESPSEEQSTKIEILKEIAAVFPDVIHHQCLSSGARLAIFHLCRSNILRSVVRNHTINAHEEKDGPVKSNDANWTLISYFYQVLLKLQLYNHVMSFFTPIFAMELIAVGRMCEQCERDLIIRYLEGYVRKNKKQHNQLMLLCKNRLIEISEDPNGSPHEVNLVLFVVMRIYKEHTILTHEDYAVFTKALIPIVKCPGFSIFQDYLSHLYDQFIESEPRFTTMIVNALLRYWPATDVAKQPSFMSLITRYSTKMTPRDFMVLIPKIFTVNAACICSPSKTVLEAARSIWSVISLENMIKASTRIIFPLVVPAIQKANKMAWCNEQHIHISDIIKVLCDLDMKLYKHLLTLEQKPIDNEKQKHSHNTWLTIVDTAVARNTDMDCKSLQAQINTEFK